MRLGHLKGRGGFTLLELVFVVGIITLLAAATVPGYQAIVLRARATEARAMLHTIAHAELRHHRDRGSFLACPADGAVPRGPRLFPREQPCWAALGVYAEGAVRYRYAVELGADGFVALAEGDLDADGRASRYALDGKTLTIDVRDGLE